MANSPLGTVLNRLRTMLDPVEADVTDRELLRRFVARREEPAFGELVRRHGPMVLGVCRRLLGDAHAAEDAFQATFLVLVRRARAVPWRESLGGWLHGTAWRVALRARRAAGVSRLMGAHQPAHAGRSPDPSEEAATRELRRVLDQELQELPAKYRAPLVLCDLEGMTHEQAARELGWPKGSLTKRLNSGRERLRRRLVRRGVGLTAATLAAAAAKEATAAPSAALTAAAILAAEGGASTTATALAKGVVKTMWMTKVNAVTLLLTAVTVAAAVAGVGAYRTWGARAPAVPNAPAATPAEDNTDATSMPVDKAVVYHVGPVQGFQTADLPEGAALVGDRPESVDDNVHVYFAGLATLKKGDFRRRPVPAAGPNLAILAVGPVLQSGEAPGSGDDAVAVSLKRHGQELDLEMAYTEGRIAGRAVPWRPLVQVPVDLASGRYKLTVTWQARTSLPDGEALKGIAPSRFSGFVIVGEGRQESKPVRVNGAEFRTFVQARVEAPAVGEERPVDLGLRVANVSDKTLIFPRYPTLKLTTADGKDVPGFGITPLWLADPETAVDAGKSKDLTPLYGSLRRTADGKQLQLYAIVYGHEVQFFQDVKPGKYLLSAEYNFEKATASDRPFWTGTVKSEPVAFEVLDAANASKPVRVEGLEFTATAPVRVEAPAPGGKTDVDIEMRVVNVSKNPLVLTTFDVIRPRLITPDGKEIEPALRGRKDTPKITPPVTLAPGDHWAWRPEATLQWTTDRATLVLTGPDGRGVNGEWSFTTLHPGKYGLVVEYVNKTMEETRMPNWVGTAATEPVEFEITGR